MTVRAIYHGGYARERGIEGLLEGVRGLGGIELFLRGLGPLPPHVEAAIPGAATVLPRVPMTELVASLAGFDIGVVPYRPTCLNNRLATPNKLFEYMAAGLAIAAADLPEIRRIVEECDCGVLFDPTDPADIARVLDGLAADRPALDRMKENSRRAAAGPYSWERQRRALLVAVADCIYDFHYGRRR